MLARRAAKFASLTSAILLGTLALFAQSSSQPAKDTARERADAIVQKMTLEEKLDYIGGRNVFTNALPRLGVPALQQSDGPFGIRNDAAFSGFPTTVYPGGIGLAASWNPELAERVGASDAKDAKSRGIHFLLAPGVNIYRAPMNGRNFEYLGEDPFLASSVVVGFINGVQKQGVSATVKHFVGNNSEFDRHNSDSIIDERALREIYLPAFEASVKLGHVGAIMDAYNLVNGQHMTENGHLNNRIAREEWGFPGVMMSDWVATYDGVGAANGGLDIEMPYGDHMNAKTLMPAIDDGRVKISTIDEKIRHLLQTAVRFGWLDGEQTDVSISRYSEQNHAVALDAARETMVLLKNDGRLLPLDRARTKSMLVVGPDAYPAVPTGGGSAQAIPFAAISVLQGISSFLGPNRTVYYDRGLPSLVELAGKTEFVNAAENGKPGVSVEIFDNPILSGTPVSTKILQHIDSASLTWEAFASDPESAAKLAKAEGKKSRRWIGYYKAVEAGPYEVALQDQAEGTGSRLYVDDRLVIDDWTLARALQPHATLQLSAGLHKIVAEDFQDSAVSGQFRAGIAPQSELVTAVAKTLAAKADVVVVAAGFDFSCESEGADRSFDLPFGQAELIREISAINHRTVVALTSGASVDANDWLEHVPAFIEMWYPGEQGGSALAEILFGVVNPSGRLPVTFERRWEDNPTFSSYYPEGDSKRVVYKEGIFVGYRGYEQKGVKPLYPFGYGLSYTTFQYANLAVIPKSGQAASGGHSNAVCTVSFDITNTGKREGAAVAEVYVADGHSKIARPAKELKGFAKVVLKPGETRHISVALDARAFAYFDTTGMQWHVSAGTFAILVGSSSEQIELKGSIALPEINLNTKMWLQDKDLSGLRFSGVKRIRDGPEIGTDNSLSYAGIR